MICAALASRTFNSFPRSGKTPYRSRPTISIPAIASDFAESPSVKMRVQCSAFFVPASLASSSFSIPRSLYCFFAVSCFESCLFNLDWACSSTSYTISVFLTRSSMNLSSTLKELPKFEGFVVRVSLVCESKVGFTMRQLTKTRRNCFT